MRALMGTSATKRSGPRLRCVLSGAVQSVLCLAALSFFSARPCHAADIHLRWSPPNSGTVAGYRVYFGSFPGDYSQFEDAGQSTSFILRGLPERRRYYLAVSAYNYFGIEGPPSNEVESTTVYDTANVSPSDVDGDGIPNSTDPDADGDGILNFQEAEVGTDPLIRDTDRDGTGDGRELADGTNPLDRGSFKVALSGTVCSEWNGFLSMYNVSEHVNLGAHPLPISSTLFDFYGRNRSTTRFLLPPATQYDLLVHDLPGHTSDSYGTICSVFDGVRGALDGRLVYYKPELVAPSPENYDFAFALPFTNGIRGPQYVPFNTFQPSARSQDQQNLVANWIQLTNLAASNESGELVFYDLEGAVLRRDRLSLPAGRRLDISGHQFGAWRVGLAGWHPDSSTANFQLRNARYLYDNPGTRPTFASAFLLDGAAGSGERLVVPLSTQSMGAVLEISNTSPQPISVLTNIFTSHGEPRLTQQITLQPFASHHLILDNVLLNQRGLATLRANRPESLVATAMHYGRATDGALNFLYGVSATQPIGLDLHGSYNTFLGQYTELWLLNPRPDPQSVIFSVLRYDRNPTVVGNAISVPGNGLRIIHLNDYEQSNVYGSLRVRPELTNSIVAWALRIKDGRYVFPTPVR